MTAAEPNPFLSILRGTLCGALFFLGLAGGAWAIRESLPFPEVPVVDQKLGHLAVHHDDYDTLFLGSSRMYYQIIPALFDRLAAEKGEPVHSFNAGVAGLRPPEDAYYFDRILEHPPKNLRWVFLELAPMRTLVDKDKVGTMRAVYWHDWPRLRILFERSLLPKSDNPRRKWQKKLADHIPPLADFLDHLPLFFQNEMNLGRASMVTWRLVWNQAPRRTPAPIFLGDDLAGWIRAGRPEQMTGQDLADYRNAMAERKAEPPTRETGDKISQKALEEMVAKIEKLGAKPVLIVPPTTNRKNFFPNSKLAEKALVLDFCDLQKYPELFEEDHRLDCDHLNMAGAEVFTKILVDRWTEEIKRQP